MIFIFCDISRFSEMRSTNQNQLIISKMTQLNLKLSLGEGGGSSKLSLNVVMSCCHAYCAWLLVPKWEKKHFVVVPVSTSPLAYSYKVSKIWPSIHKKCLTFIAYFRYMKMNRYSIKWNMSSNSVRRIQINSFKKKTNCSDTTLKIFLVVLWKYKIFCHPFLNQ